MSDDWNDQGDYSQWGWKAVVKAVTGQDPDHPENNGNAKSIVDPQTVQDAADTFWYAEQVIHQSAQAIREQVDALAGENGPWKGAAAQALHRVMGTLSQQVGDLGNTLSGGITGDYDIPQQLADNAAHLREAGNKLMDIDYYYAQQALAEDPSLMMDNGSVHIGAKPKLVSMMSQDMAQVMTVLGSHYQITTDNVAQPQPPANPAGAPSPYAGVGLGAPNPYNPFAGYPQNIPYYQGGAPLYAPSNAPYFSPTGYPGAGSNLPDPYQTGNPHPMPGPGIGGGPGAGNVPDYSTFPNLSTNAPGAGSPTSYSPTPYSDTSTGGTDGQLSPNTSDIPLLSPTGSSADMPNSGALDPSMDAALNPAMASMPNLRSSYPDLGLGGPRSTNKDALTKPKPYSGDLGLNDAGSLGGGTGAGPGTESITPYASKGLPNLDTSGIEAPNTSALSSYPGTGLSGGPSLGSAGGGTPSSYPGTGLESLGPGGAATSPGAGGGLNPMGRVGGPGMPMMPMMPMGGMGGMGAGGTGAEGGPSDASGLLQGDATPWSITGPGSGEATGGAGAGGAGLDFSPRGLPSDGMSLDSSGTPSDASGDGLSSGTPGPGAMQRSGSGMPMMPMMPMGGMGSTGAAGGGSEGGPSDASGLLQGDATPWRTTGPNSVEATGGAGAGGAGLDFSPRGLPSERLPTGASDGAGQSESGMPMMPVMPMGGMGAGTAGSGTDGGPSDASGLLRRSTEGWSDDATQGDAPVGSSAGAPQGGGDLSPGDADHVEQQAAGADAPAVQEAAAEAGGQDTANTEAFGAGVLNGMPFLASSWGAAGQPVAPAPQTGVTNGTGPAAAPSRASATPRTGRKTRSPRESSVPQAAPSAASAPEAAPSHTAPVPHSPPLQALTSRSAPAAVHQPVSAPAPAPAEQAPAAAVAGQGPSPTQQASASAPRQAAQATSAPVPSPSPASAPTQGSARVPAAKSADSTPSTASSSAQAKRGEAPSAGSQGSRDASFEAAADADDAEAWDASLLPLFGGRDGRSGGVSGADAGLNGEEAVGAAGVVGASAYVIARGAGAGREVAGPARPAWRPKPPSEGGPPRREFVCAGGGPEPKAAPVTPDGSEKDESAAGQSKGRSKKRDEDGGSSVADLLRQSEDIWGGGS